MEGGRVVEGWADCGRAGRVVGGGCWRAVAETETTRVVVAGPADAGRTEVDVEGVAADVEGSADAGRAEGYGCGAPGVGFRVLGSGCGVRVWGPDVGDAERA